MSSPLRIALLFVDDHHEVPSEDRDESARWLEATLTAAGHVVVRHLHVPHERDTVHAQLRAWGASPAVDVVLVRSKSAHAALDRVPDWVEAQADDVLPGFAWALRDELRSAGAEGLVTLRATAAVIGTTLVVSFPAARDRVEAAWKVLALELGPTRADSLGALVAVLREH